MGKFFGMKLDSILAIGVIALVAYFVAGYAGLLAAVGPSTVPIGPVCEFDDVVTLSLTGARSLLDTTGAETGVATETVNVYTSTDPTTIADSAILVAGLTANNTIAVPCHTQYKFGYGSATYYNGTYPASGYLGAEHAAEATKFKMDLVGAITTSLDNNTVLGSASFTVAGGGSATLMGAAATSVPLTLHIRQTTAQGIYKAPIIIGFAYNATAFASMRAIGWQSIACPSWTPAITFAATNENNPYRSCFVYNTDMKDVQELLVPLELVSAADPVITNVTIRVDDTGGAFKNGALVTGFINPDNGQGWGAATATHIIHVE